MQYFERGQCYWLYFDKVQCNGNCSWENTRNFRSSHENIRFTQLQRVQPMRKKLLVYIWALYCRSMHALNFDNQHILVNTLRKYKCIGDFSLGEPLISNLTAPLPTQSQKNIFWFCFVFLWALYRKAMPALNCDGQPILANILGKHNCIGEEREALQLSTIYAIQVFCPTKYEVPACVRWTCIGVVVNSNSWSQSV